ncbi:MAG: hypothetical protein ACTSUE_01535 [Promethearchaeota archaeon]
MPLTSHERNTRKFLYVVLLLVPLFTLSIIKPVSAAPHLPTKKTVFTLDMWYYSRISWSENQKNMVYAWDVANETNDQNITFGIISKQNFHEYEEMNWDIKKNITIPSTFKKPSFPSIVLLENGTLVLSFYMVEKIKTKGDLYVMDSPDNGTTWTTPVRISRFEMEDYRNSYLLKVNSTHLVSMWEEKEYVSGFNYSLVYRVSNDTGRTWDPQVTLLENITSGLSSCHADNGSFILGMVFNDYATGTYTPYTLYNMTLHSNVSGWTGITPTINENLSVSTKFNFLMFEGGEVVLINTGSSFQFYNFTSGLKSKRYEFNVEDALKIGNPIIFMKKYSTDKYLIFYRAYNPVTGTYNAIKYVYANYFDWVSDLKPASNLVWFIALISIIVGGQVLIYVIYKYRKKNATAHGRPPKGRRLAEED